MPLQCHKAWGPAFEAVIQSKFVLRPVEAVVPNILCRFSPTDALTGVRYVDPVQDGPFF
jgi:hypothetical protein